jgi:hypothetical protein
MTLHPACASPSAMAKPKPPVDPVRSATRPCSEPFARVSEVLHGLALMASLIIQGSRLEISTQIIGRFPCLRTRRTSGICSISATLENAGFLDELSRRRSRDVVWDR